MHSKLILNPEKHTSDMDTVKYVHPLILESSNVYGHKA